MIKSKDDLKFYLSADKFMMGISRKRPSLLRDHIWKFLIALRKHEYYSNNPKRSVMGILLNKIYSLRKYQLGLKLGFDIPGNVLGAGVRINHFGNIVINKSVRIGMWCDIHQGVNIGSNNSVNGGPLVPTLGNNIWIGPGAKIFGDIKISDGVQIAANSVVNKSVEANCTVAGVPAKIISNTGTESINVAASKQRMKKFIDCNQHYKSYFESIITK